MQDIVANITPHRSEGNPEEVADLVAVIAANESSLINGKNIDFNGGLLFS